MEINPNQGTGVVPNCDPCQIITPLVLVGLGLGVGEGLGLGNQTAISTRGVIIWQGVKNGHNTGFTDEMCMTIIQDISPSPKKQFEYSLF